MARSPIRVRRETAVPPVLGKENQPQMTRDVQDVLCAGLRRIRPGGADTDVGFFC